MVLLDDGTEDGIRLNKPYLSREELIGIVARCHVGVLSYDGGGYAPVDVHDGGGFVDRGQTLGDDVRHDYGPKDEGCDPPAVAFDDPEVVR